MAATTAYVVHDAGIRGVIAIYVPTEFVTDWEESAENPDDAERQSNLEESLGGTPRTAGAAYLSSSAALLVDSAAPTTLIVQGYLDVHVYLNQGEILAEKLAGAGVPNALESLPGPRMMAITTRSSTSVNPERHE